MSKYQKIGKNDGREDLLFYPNTSILLDYGRIKCEYKKRQTSKTMFVFILNQNFNRKYICDNYFCNIIDNICTTIMLYKLEGSDNETSYIYNYRN